MEADWDVEIGGDAPVIDAAWSGLVDLRRYPERVDQIAETAALPALRAALVQLNAEPSPVWTSKCDVWVPEALDADELDAPAEAAVTGLACYIDLLQRGNAWDSVASTVDACRRACALLRGQSLRQARIDFVVRRAVFSQHEWGYGVTAYVAACGADEQAAQGFMAGALEALCRAFLPHTPAQPKIQ